MKDESVLNYINNQIAEPQVHIEHPAPWRNILKQNPDFTPRNDTSEILFITSFPPRECGIATYSEDLLKALKNKFHNSFKFSICALETEHESYSYSEEIKYKLNTDLENSFTKLAFQINKNSCIKIVFVQHEFGFFEHKKKEFQQFLDLLKKPLVITFHTVLPNPGEALKLQVKQIVAAAESIIVMTNSSAELLVSTYGIARSKIEVIAHGTHLVSHSEKNLLKNKYELSGKIVLSTFGLIGPGKGIETTIEALPELVEKNRNVVFLIIGKTHPGVSKHDGESYRLKLEARVEELQLQQHVHFINYFLPQSILLEYLQLTDIYLFTSRDPNQAVSGTFSYAISCGCPVISTPIPHAKEVLNDTSGIIIDFDNSVQLSRAVTKLIENEDLRNQISSNGIHKMASTAWENTAISHAILFQKLSDNLFDLHFTIPKLNLNHLKKMTTNFGMIQFSKLNNPDIQSGYTLDDNARALIAMCQQFENSRNDKDLEYITIYFNFIKFCLQPEGYFLNYVNEQHEFTEQNNTTNLADSNGRAIWALGYLISIAKLLPEDLLIDAESTMESALVHVNKIHSTRAIAFVIKGLYYRNSHKPSAQPNHLIEELANRLVQMYRHESSPSWQWYESYFTYANSIIPEALLCAWMVTKNETYKEIAKDTFDFLLSKIFTPTGIHVISNKNWLQRGATQETATGGEQPIDVAYTILALDKFSEAFPKSIYKDQMKIAFSWFLGNNELNQIIYNPCTGGCYDGLETQCVNLNQGAESTLSYLLARLNIDKFEIPQRLPRYTEKKINTNVLLHINT